ncbi:ABC transporter permease [Ureaplasma canigenitalium]|uniref:ABC transporter permease n=1 Tax=Ureaplasma canigenitalium TaxID=42092 RepID=UPI0009FE9DA1|nr:ABC transporter permease [Ureaplasma canigenitalium]
MNTFKTRLFFDSLFYSSKSRSVSKKILSTIISIFSAVVASAILVGILGYDTNDFLQRLFTKWKLIPEFYLTKVAILGIAALSFIFTYKVGIFNIGISGQMLGAGLIMLLVVKNMELANINMPKWAGQFFLLVIGMLAGAMFTVFIGILKIFLKINEVVSSILLNWIIFYITRYVVFTSQNKIYNPKPTQIGDLSIPFAENYSLSHLVPKYTYLFNLLIFVSLALLVFIILQFTVFGKKILSVGRSASASKYAGYKTKAISLLTFAISGMLAGALAMVTYTGTTTNAINIPQTSDVLPLEGFDGIAIGLISQSHPLASIPVSFLVGMFQQSTQVLGGIIPKEVSGIIISFVMLGAALFVLFERISPVYWTIVLLYTRKGVEHYRNYENVNEDNISEYYFIYREISKNEKKNMILLKKYLIDLNRHKQDGDYPALKEQYYDLKQKVKEHFKNLYLIKYQEYIKAMRDNRNQLMKHFIVDRASLLFFPEIYVERHVENRIKYLETKRAAVLNHINNKIGELDDVLNIIIKNHISHYLFSFKINYDYLKSVKKDIDKNKPIRNEQVVQLVKYASKSSSMNKLIRYLKKLKIMNDTVSDYDEDYLKDLINNQFTDHYEKVMELRTHSFNDLYEISKIMVNLNSTYKRILKKKEKLNKKYQAQKDAFNNRPINVEKIRKEVAWKVPKYSYRYLMNAYLRFTKKVQKSTLDIKEKSLLQQWLNVTTNKALHQSINTSKEEGYAHNIIS